MRILYRNRDYWRLVKAFSLSTALVAVSLGAAFAGGAKRFQNVNDWLYRGGRPSQEDVVKLREMGIKTILNLYVGPPAESALNGGANRRAVNRYDNARPVRGRTYLSWAN